MGNLRIPRMRITALHVEGILRMLDERAAVRPAPTPPTLRYPQDFPGARATGGCRSCGEGELPLPEQNICPPCQLQADVHIVAEHGNDADVMIEIDAQHEEARAAMIDSAIALDEAEGVSSWDADITHYSAEEVAERAATVLPALATLDLADRAEPSEPDNVVVFATHGTSLAHGGPIVPGSIVTLPMHSPRPLPRDWLRERQVRLQEAMAWLQRCHGISVRAIDRNADIKRYQIGGRLHDYLASEVIDEAIKMGWEG